MTYISWFSDFALYLEDSLMYEPHTLGLWIEPWPQNKYRSLKPIFHGPVIWRYMTVTVYGMCYKTFTYISTTNNIEYVITILDTFCLVWTLLQIRFLFDFTAAGVVPCGGRKTSPRTSTIVQFIFYFGPSRSAIIFWEIRNKWLV